MAQSRADTKIAGPATIPMNCEAWITTHRFLITQDQKSVLRGPTKTPDLGKAQSVQGWISAGTSQKMPVMGGYCIVYFWAKVQVDYWKKLNTSWLAVGKRKQEKSD